MDIWHTMDNIVSNITAQRISVKSIITEGLRFVAVDGTTITGDGTPGNPLVAVGGGSGYGDMSSAIYDPNNLNADAFDYNNFINVPIKLSDFSNDTNFITITALSGYATESYVNSQGFITAAALSPYLTSATAASTYSVLGHTHTFSSITGKPTTLSGYGITDAYPLTGNPSSFLTTISGLNNSLLTNDSGFITAAALSPYLTSATAASTYQPLDSDLTTIAGLTATTDNFIVAVSSAWASRTPAQVKSTLSLNNVENTALSTWAGSANITTLGTVSSGIWAGTAIATTNGGTGLTSYTTGDLLYASATNVLSKLAVGTNGHVLTLSGGVPTWAAAASGGSTLSSITAATTNATINSAANAIEWQWNSLTSGVGLQLSSTSTAATSNTQTLFSVALSGSNSNSSQSTYAAQFSNTHTGTSSTNYALKLSASGATNNYGLTSDCDLLVNGITVGKGKWQGTNSSYNTAFGLNALGSASSGGVTNTAFGRDALSALTGSIQNTALGCGAMKNATSYANCVGVGYNALAASTGSQNTGVGCVALTNQTSGDGNTAMGSAAGERLTTGSDNVFIGAYIFNIGSNRGASENTLVGSSVGRALTASTTTAFGSKSLFTKTSGANCVAIGYKAGYDVTTAANSVYIGNSLATSHATKDNIILLSDGSGNERVMIESDGRVGIGTTSPAATAKLDLTSTTQGFLLPRMTSTQRDAITSPAEMLLIANTTTKKLNFYNGTSWEVVTSA